MTDLVTATAQGKVSKQKARDVFRAMLGNEKSVEEVIAQLGLGQISDDAVLREALQKAQARGDRLALAQAMNDLGVATGSRDMARKRHYYRRSRELARAINHRRLQIRSDNNLAGLYMRLGLYSRALALAQSATNAARQSQMRIRLSYYVDTLARVAWYAGLLDLSRSCYDELVYLAQETGQSDLLANGKFGLGQLALDEGRQDDAAAALSEAVAFFDQNDMTEEKAFALSWLAASHLALGEPAPALASSAEAMHLAQAHELTGVDFPPQEIWWWRFRALESAHGETDEAWQTLDQARQVMFEAVANINDEGLRRNYLNKPAVNRAISETWTEQAAQRGQSLAPFTQRETIPAALSEQMERIVDSGARLAAERDTEALAEFVLQEFVELSGVERAIVALPVEGRREEPGHKADNKEVPQK